jgi:hypothetical protein
MRKNNVVEKTIDQISSWNHLIDRFLFIRAILVSLVVGSTLTLVNQSGWFFGDIPVNRLQLALVFALPFGVVCISQLLGLKRYFQDSLSQEISASESIYRTAFSHDIPWRANIVAMGFFSLNAIAVFTDAYLRSIDFSDLSFVSLAQAFALPFVFSILSQTLAYRSCVLKFS